MRGVPGSGKTTMARAIAGKKGVIHSTDEFFVEKDIYNFDPIKLRENHEKNLKGFTESLKKGIPIVICDNTNIKRSEFEPYIRAAKQHGYEVKIVSLPHPDPEVAAKRNSHGVGADAIRRMIEKFEP